MISKSMTLISISLFIGFATVFADENEFLQKFQLSFNPFSQSNAEDISDGRSFVTAAVKLPEFSVLESRPSFFVFGVPGCGKTFLRIMLMNSLRQKHGDSLLLINITNKEANIQNRWLTYESKKGWNQENWNINDICDIMIAQAMDVLVNKFLKSKPTEAHLGSLSFDQASWLYLWGILHDVSLDLLRQLRSVLRVTDHRGVLSIPAGKQLHNQIRVFSFDSDRTGMLEEALLFFKKDPSNFEFRGLARVAKIEELAKALGFTTMVVVVDSLDEVAVMKDCPTCLKTFVSPLMNQAVLASLNLMAFVPFARSSITPAEEELINCLKRPCINLSWDYGELFHVLSKWWSFAASNRSSLSTLFHVEPQRLFFVDEAMNSNNRRCNPRLFLDATKNSVDDMTVRYFRLPESARSSFEWKIDERNFRENLIKLNCLDAPSYWELLKSYFLGPRKTEL